MTDSQNGNELKETGSFRKAMYDYLIMLGALLISACFHYDIKALTLTALAAGTAAVTRKIGEKLTKTASHAPDFAAITAGACCAMLLPATAPWWIAVFMGFFAAAVCIVPFGSAEGSPFVPAAAAVCFAVLCWSDKVFLYSDEGAMGLSSMLAQNNAVGRNSVAVLEVLSGSIPSAIGAGSIGIILGALVYLTLRRPSDSLAVYSFLFSVCLFAVLFPRVSTGRLMSVIMELCSGMLLFAAVFFISYPSVMPKRLFSKIIWGLFSGLVCMLIRYFSPLEEAVCFGVLICGACSDLFDRLPLLPIEKKRLEAAAAYIEIAPPIVPTEVLEEIPDVSPEAEENGGGGDV